MKLDTWMNAFADGFSDTSSRSLGNVCYWAVRPLAPDVLVLVYEDWEKHLSARAYRVADLDKFSGLPREVVRSIVVSELIEPTVHGRTVDSELLRGLNAEFPGLEWIGEIPA
ncbi:hypothetical protein ACIPY1_13640 [Paenarthrobacter nicotinovorans]|uniref:hypothetical protein n=1 Tax=Paenarthrobacter nicotinovorans TaxID=29320 RepID=UPI0037F55E2E